MSTDTCTHESCETSVTAPETTKGAKTLKAAIVVLADPKSGSQEEALGRVFNALAAAYDFKQRGDDVSLFSSKEPARAGSVISTSKTIQLTLCSRKSRTRSPECRVAVPMCLAAAKRPWRPASI